MIRVDTAVELKVINMSVYSAAQPEEHSYGNVSKLHFRGKGGCLGKAVCSLLGLLLFKFNQIISVFISINSFLSPFFQGIWLAIFYLLNLDLYLLFFPHKMHRTPGLL